MVLEYFFFNKTVLLMPFSGLAPSKLKLAAYVHKEYSTYQFSEESKGGWNRYRKKSGPERVKINSHLEFNQDVQCYDTYIRLYFRAHCTRGKQIFVK